MATVVELRHSARALVHKLDEVANDPEMSLDDKKVALDAIEEEYKSVSSQIENSERAAEMRAKLEGFGDVKDVSTGATITKFEAPSPLSRSGIKALAAEFVSHPGVQKVFGFKDGFREKLDVPMVLGLKDATEGNNLMGEGLYGTTGPTAAGQTPFLPGAWGPGIQPDWRPGIVEQLFYQLTINDLISSFATTAPNVSYLTENPDNLTSNQTAEGQLFPFSSIEVSRAYSQIGKVAGAMTITDEAIADAATLFNFVQGRLLLSVQRQEEVQVLAGSGYPGVSGLLSFASNFTASSAGSIFGATSGTGTNVSFPPANTYGAGAVSQTVASLPYGRVVTGQSGAYPTPLVTALALKDAAVDIELAVFHSPTAYVMNPRDWQRLETAQDTQGQFMNTSYFGLVYGAKHDRVKTLWDVPVVTTPLMPEGIILVGWFDPQTVQIARRQGIQMQMTNSNESDFIEGRITVRADERLGLLCYRPTAFELVNLVA